MLLQEEGEELEEGEAEADDEEKSTDGEIDVSISWYFTSIFRCCSLSICAQNLGDLLTIIDRVIVILVFSLYAYFLLCTAVVIQCLTVIWK